MRQLWLRRWSLEIGRRWEQGQVVSGGLITTFIWSGWQIKNVETQNCFFEIKGWNKSVLSSYLRCCWWTQLGYVPHNKYLTIDHHISSSEPRNNFWFVHLRPRAHVDIQNNTCFPSLCRPHQIASITMSDSQSREHSIPLAVHTVLWISKGMTEPILWVLQPLQ